MNLDTLLESYKEKLNELEEILGIRFRNKKTLLIACIHSSFANENRLETSNERIEFLGDAVLSFVIADYLYRRKKKLNEGELAKLKSAIVSEESLCEAARSLNLWEFLLLGKGAAHEKSGEKSNLADFAEALIGAIYLDRGIRMARRFVLEKLLGRRLINFSYSDYDPKSTLQEHFLAQTTELPRYEVIKVEGPPHDRCFTVRVRHGNRILGIGTGRSKKQAEKEAAREALKELQKENEIE